MATILSELGVDEISESDYFRKSSEFQIWLRDERGKFFDELTGDKARRWQAWNQGKLSKSIYMADAATEGARSAATHTAYKWAFAGNDSKISQAELKAAREAVNRATHRSEKTLGPTMPPSHGSASLATSASDRTLQREAEIDGAKQERRGSNKRSRERIEDEDGGVGPKLLGREGMMEKKRAKREEDRAMRNRKEDGGLEVAEDFLMGSGHSDSFQAAIMKRDAARARWAEQKQAEGGTSQARREAMKAKDAQTMAMFQNLAKERFG